MEASDRLTWPLGGLMRAASQVGAVQPGDVVRLATSEGARWFYCQVHEVLDDDELVCSVIEAQSWPDLVLQGVVPGRRYCISSACALSVVRSALH